MCRTKVPPYKGESPFSPFHSPFSKGDSPFLKGDLKFIQSRSPFKRVNAFTLKGESPFSPFNSPLKKGESPFWRVNDHSPFEVKEWMKGESPFQGWT